MISQIPPVKAIARMGLCMTPGWLYAATIDSGIFCVAWDERTLGLVSARLHRIAFRHEMT